MKKLRQQKLTLLISFATVLQTGSAQALEREVVANVREGKKIVQRSVVLKELTSPDCFVGSYFKVVFGKEDVPICFDADPETLLRASTVYHHLTIARDYFLEQKIHSRQMDEQITVRIGVDREFSQFLHFKGEKFSEYNGSLTIGPSNEFINTDLTEPWGTEIWYFQPKRVKRKTGSELLAEAVNRKGFRKNLMKAMLDGDAMDFVVDTVQRHNIGIPFRMLDVEEFGISVGISITLAQTVPRAFEMIAHLSAKKYKLDSAMIPEITHHEYAHVALSGELGLFQSTALTEGIPNYFASKISGLRKLGANARKYNSGDAPKNGDSKSLYSFQNEYRNPYGSFVFSLLLDIEEALGEYGHDVILAAIPYLNSKSTIYEDLQRALPQAVIDVVKERDLDLTDDQMETLIQSLILKAKFAMQNRGI